MKFGGAVSIFGLVSVALGRTNINVKIPDADSMNQSHLDLRTCSQPWSALGHPWLKRKNIYLKNLSFVHALFFFFFHLKIQGWVVRKFVGFWRCFRGIANATTRPKSLFSGTRNNWSEKKECIITVIIIEYGRHISFYRFIQKIQLCLGKISRWTTPIRTRSFFSLVWWIREDFLILMILFQMELTISHFDHTDRYRVFS